MKALPILLLILITFGIASGQNEQSPIVEKEFGYRNWTYQNIDEDGKTNLREFTKGKKLVMVVYWAPWCPNWEYDAAFVQGLYEKYKSNGFEIIGVGEYDPLDKMKAHIRKYKLTFPSVYESQASADREKTVHFLQRREAGDTRKWGSPWYVFLEPEKIEKSGDVISKKTKVINGEMMRGDVEKFIREKLGMSADTNAAIAKSGEIEVCEPEKKATPLVKP